MTEGSPAVRRAHELAHLSHTGDRAAARAYVEQHFDLSVLGIPMAMHLDFISQLHDLTRGVAVLAVHHVEATTATLLIRGELTGIVQGLVVQVEASAPFRVTGFYLQNLPQTAAGEPVAPLAAASLPGELAAWLQTLAEADIFSGAVGLAKDGELLFAQAYGQANKDFAVPNTMETAFNLGSMNKMFTAVAIAQLVEQGRLSFDDRLAGFLPDFPSAEAAGQIQIKHLLSHTSGLGSYFTEQFLAASRARFRSVDDFLALVRDQVPKFPPGSQQQYSNTGFLILGAIIEAVTGRDYFEHMRAALYEPAGMPRTEAYELDRVNANLAVGYSKEYTERGPVFRNNLFEHVIRGGPAGGGYSTLHDLVRFATALHTHHLLSPATTSLLLTPKPELQSPTYGYGFSIGPAAGLVGHNGGFAGISTNLDLFRDSGYVAVVLSNYGWVAHLVVAKLRALIEAALT
jgi:CubicO group peptidase (beta-lactamase class C family)